MNSAVIELPQEVFTPASFTHFSGELVVGELTVGPDTYEFAEPAQWQVDVSHTGEALYLHGSVQGEGSTACARCLEPTHTIFEGELEGYYYLGGANVPEDDEAEDTEILSPEHRIDLEEKIMAALVLDVPIVPLCSEDCLGLCVHCGANLNEGPCGCEEETDEVDISNPFAALKGLRFD